MSAANAQLPPAVSKRNHFDSAACLVERYANRAPASLRTPDVLRWLTTYTECVVRDVAHSFAVGAERGIKQTADLLCDPQFYETRKQRRERWRQQREEEEQRREAERLERRLSPTREQIEEDRPKLKKWIEEGEQHLADMKARLKQLEAMAGNVKHFRITESRERES